jgi:hypothetical protein
MGLQQVLVVQQQSRHQEVGQLLELMQGRIQRLHSEGTVTLNWMRA